MIRNLQLRKEKNNLKRNQELTSKKKFQSWNLNNNTQGSY